MPTWRSLRTDAPEIVAVGEERLLRFRLGMLGTIRADGSPRISLVEPHIGGGELLFAVIHGSAKAGDLERDPRCALHSIVDDADAGDPELTLRGRFVEVDEATRGADPEAWWLSYAERHPVVGTIELEAATLLRFDVAGEISVMSWTPAGGVTLQRKPYP
jgi:pyridoxamine 5'-phosphate oxidase-like protein